MTSVKQVVRSSDITAKSIQDGAMTTVLSDHHELSGLHKGISVLIFLAFWLFFSVVRPPLFGLGRGLITPPGPAMVRMNRKDLNLNKCL